MAGLFKDKKGVIMGIANQHSIAAGIAKFLIDEGAEVAFSFLPDDTGKMEGRIRKVVGEWNPKCSPSHLFLPPPIDLPRCRVAPD